VTRVVGVLATLDTKGPEAQFLREQIEAQGCRAVLVDIGVVGEPGTRPDIPREDVARAGGTELAEILRKPTRQDASPVMVAGAIALLMERQRAGELHALVGLGGTQGTSNASAIMRAFAYGFPKIMVSTAASGDVSSFVDIKDVTMMFSVSDLLGLNPVTRKILANAAGAACGMAGVDVALEPESGDRPLIGMSNLGVLTEGAMEAVAAFEEAGYEVIVFHAVGSGGRAMEQLMKDGVIGAVFDYAMGEISDELFDGFRAGSPERLTVAGGLGLPQVLCPGGTEHIGVFVEPDAVPDAWKGHTYVFHNPVIFVPRLSAEQMARVAREIGERLKHTKGRATMFLPNAGVSRYSKEGGPLYDPEGEAAFLAALRESLPETVELVAHETHAEDPAFVRAAVARLIELIEQGQPASGV
jgi:uncharacterized protein (UPF0261 family)